MVDISNDKWINIDEAAEYLGVKARDDTRLDQKRKRHSCSQNRKTMEI